MSKTNPRTFISAPGGYWLSFSTDFERSSLYIGLVKLAPFGNVGEVQWVAAKPNEDEKPWGLVGYEDGYLLGWTSRAVASQPKAYLAKLNDKGQLIGHASVA